MQGPLTGSALRGAVAAVCGTAFLLFGYDQGVLGAVIGLPSFRADFDNPSAKLEGIIAAIYDIGCFTGAIVAFLTADRYGRKGSINRGCWIMVIGTILQASATGSVQLIIARIVTGVGNGINTVNVPVWQAESFKSHNRGALLIIQSALIAFGHPLSTFMGLASSQAEPSSFAWRWPIAFQGVFLVIILMTLPFLPESPRWLAQHDKIDEAVEVFARLEGKGVSKDHPSVIIQRDEVMASVRQELLLGSTSWGEVFTEGKNRNLSRVLLGIGPYMMNQWCGINSLAYFLPITFERNISLSTQLSLVISGILGMQYFLVSWIPYFFIERVGRRKMLMSSATACCFCMIMISAMLAVDTTLTQWIFVAFTFLFFDAFSLGILPVSWMYASEIMPLRTRNKGVALGAASHWLSNFVVVYVTPQAIQTLGYRLYLIWALLNATFVPVTWLFYPETARRSLEDMDQVFLRETFGVTKTRTPGTRVSDEYDAVTARR
ncbi:general substrate transporter [Usnea florida]